MQFVETPKRAGILIVKKGTNKTNWINSTLLQYHIELLLYLQVILVMCHYALLRRSKNWIDLSTMPAL
jgi:hypothetical protein